MNRVFQIVRLAAFVVWELLRANIRVTAAVLDPRRRFRPGIIAVPLAVTSDLQITLLANLITLTPGSLSLTLSDDRRTLYVHCLDVGDPEEARRHIKMQLERLVREATE